jgi:hypothetical protein
MAHPQVLLSTVHDAERLAVDDTIWKTVSLPSAVASFSSCIVTPPMVCDHGAVGVNVLGFSPLV